jgi:hypothetical protein
MGGNRIIAEIEGLSTEGKAAEAANAALIAAAPELLATAKRLADWGSMETPNTPENLASIITDAVRAIAKAEGGAE